MSNEKQQEGPLTPEQLERIERCKREINAILEREKCAVAVTPFITVNGRPLQVSFIPEERIRKPGVS